MGLHALVQLKTAVSLGKFSRQVIQSYDPAVKTHCWRRMRPHFEP
jgi:hypothetical protein